MRLLTTPTADRSPIELQWPWPALVYLRRAELFLLATGLPLLPLIFISSHRSGQEAAANVSLNCIALSSLLNGVRSRLQTRLLLRALSALQVVKAQSYDELGQVPIEPPERRAAETVRIAAVVAEASALEGQLNPVTGPRFSREVLTLVERVRALVADVASAGGGRRTHA